MCPCSATVIFGNPGAGKTTKLASMFKQELANYPADQMKFLSYTKAAARETLKKIDGLSDISGASTIHSLVYALTKVESPQVVTKSMLKEFGSKIGFPMSGGDYGMGGVSEADEYLALYSMSRNLLVTPTEAYSHSIRPGNPQSFRYFVKAYESWKSAWGYIDFDDMLCKYLDGEHRHPYKILFVDEAQDLSPMQWLVMDKMALSVDKIVVVGDPHQSLFLWSGADRRGMAEFEIRHKAHRVVLGKSYRVPRAVAKVARAVARDLSWDGTGYEPRDYDGSVVAYGGIDSLTWDDRDTLVLYRTHYTRKGVERVLINAGVSYTVESGLPGIAQSKPMRAIDAWEKIRGTNCFMSTKDKMLIRSVATDRLARNMDGNNETSMYHMPWHRVMHLPDDVVNFRMSNAGNPPNVRMSTIHGAKGREADRVILLTDMTTRTVEGMMKDPEAEAMVWYVACTRARESLDLVMGQDGYKIPTPH